MRNQDQKTLLNWFRNERLTGEGWKKRHEIPHGNTEFGFFTPRMADKTIRDLARLGYLESRPAGKLREWRYIPRSENEPEQHSSDEIAFFSVNGFFPPKETPKLI